MLELERIEGLRILGRMEEARQIAQTCFTDSETIDDDGRKTKILEGERLLRLGKLDHDQGRYTDALIPCKEALEIFEECGHFMGLAQSHELIGMIYLNLNRIDDAESVLNRGLQISQLHTLKSEEAKILRLLGQLYKSRGDYERSLDFYYRSLTLFRQQNNLITQGMILVQSPLYTMTWVIRSVLYLFAKKRWIFINK